MHKRFGIHYNIHVYFPTARLYRVSHKNMLCTKQDRGVDTKHANFTGLSTDSTHV
jgi:hypothetical protein